MASGIHFRLKTETFIVHRPGVRKRDALMLNICTLEGGNAVIFFKNGFRHAFSIDDGTKHRFSSRSVKKRRSNVITLNARRGKCCQIFEKWFLASILDCRRKKYRSLPGSAKTRCNTRKNLYDKKGEMLSNFSKMVSGIYFRLTTKMMRMG